MMGMTYSFAVPSDWTLGAKDYFRMGADNTGMTDNDGISSFLVQFAQTSNFLVPQQAQKAWAFLASHILNVMPLTDAGWEDLYVETTGLPERGCQLRFTIQNEDMTQPLVYLNLYRDTKPISSKDETLQYRLIDETDDGNRLKALIAELEPIAAAPLKLLMNYFSPSYRIVKEPNTAVEIIEDATGQRARRRVYCVQRQNGITTASTWWVETQTFVLSEAFRERYVPLSMEEDEAQVFFGHIPLEPLWDIITRTWKTLIASVRLCKARRGPLV